MHLLGLDGHAAPRLHLPAGTGLGRPEPARDHRRGRSCASASSCSSSTSGVSLRRGRVAGANPWDAGTLEWATPLAAAELQLRAYPGRRQPRPAVGRSRRPAGGQRASDRPARGAADDGRRCASRTCASRCREPSIWPLISALADRACSIGSIFTPWAVLWGAIPVAIAVIGWFWPKSPPDTPEPAID